MNKTSGFFAALAAVLSVGLFVTNLGYTQGAPPATAVAPGEGFSNQRFGGQVPMMPGNFEVRDDPIYLYIIRADRVIRVHKSTMKIEGEVMLPGMQPRPAPFGGPAGGSK